MTSQIARGDENRKLVTLHKRFQYNPRMKNSEATPEPETKTVSRREETLMSESSEPDLSDILRKVHSELLRSESRRESQGVPSLFALSEFTLELNFVLKSESQNRGGFDLKLVTAGAESKYASEKIQKITLTFKPSSEQAAAYRRRRGEFPSKQTENSADE